MLYCTKQNPTLEIKKAGVRLCAAGLSPRSSGNISVRHDDGFSISPSATRYEDIDVVPYIRFEFGREEVATLTPKPSSEWPFHKAIYQAYDHVQAVVHCHSHYAQVLSCVGRFKYLPASFHYMMQIMGGNVRRVPYETPGSDRLARSAVAGLRGRSAVLLGNHGPVVVGESIEVACERAEVLEELCRIFTDAVQIGRLAEIPKEQLVELPEVFKNYGQPK